MKATPIGVLAALFFSITFILNHAISSYGGSWLFSSLLRFFFIFYFYFSCFLLFFFFFSFFFLFLFIVLFILLYFLMWFLWSFFGFVFFSYYSLLYPTIVQAGFFLRHGN